MLVWLNVLLQCQFYLNICHVSLSFNCNFSKEKAVWCERYGDDRLKFVIIIFIYGSRTEMHFLSWLNGSYLLPLLSFSALSQNDQLRGKRPAGKQQLKQYK